MSALLGLIAHGGFGDGHMGGGWGWLVVVALVVIIGAIGWMMMRGAGSNGRLSEDPVAVLKARYARGELTTEEFQERLRTIDDALSVGPG